MKNILVKTLITVALSMSFQAHAEETTGEKINTGTNKIGDQVERNAIDASYEACKKLNGDASPKCLAKKVKSEAKLKKSEAGTKAQDLKNKVD